MSNSFDKYEQTFLQTYLHLIILTSSSATFSVFFKDQWPMKERWKQLRARHNVYFSKDSSITLASKYLQCSKFWPNKLLNFFPLMYGLQALCLGHKSMAKNLVHNLQYEPKTWLIRGIYGTILSATEEVKRVLKGRCTEHLWHTHPQNNLGGIYDLASEIFDVCSKTFNIKIAKKMSMHATSRNIIALKIIVKNCPV